MFRPIAISLSPNTQKEDYLLALKLLFSPRTYIRGKYIKKLENWFSKYFKVGYAFSFDSGRSAQFTILSSLGITKGDEVLIQAFTCVAVPNSILWTGAKPVYVDVEKNSFNMSPADLKRKINKNTKAIIVQHTFGMAAQILKIKEIATNNKLILIEDCAHSLGATVNEEKIGTFGDLAFFSFGRDKVISSIFGGMAITNNKKIAKKISKFQNNLSFPTVFWVMQQLLHSIIFSVILPVYNLFGLGKIILLLAQKLHLLSLPITNIEKEGGKPRFYPKKLPNSLAKLALIQLERLEEFNKKRQAIARIYQKEFGGKVEQGDIFLRFPLLVKNPKKLLNFAKKKGILLGDWYSNIIDPKGVNLKKIAYTKGSCPIAEGLASRVVNLPTYPRMTRADIERVVKAVKNDYAKI